MKIIKGKQILNILKDMLVSNDNKEKPMKLTVHITKEPEVIIECDITIII